MAGNVIGITSSVPVEAIFASGRGVSDLNNVFVEDADGASLVEYAERRGFPESSCAWIKGIYGAARLKDVRSVVAVTQGDCSNTHALMEVLETDGVETIPFAYPYDRDRRCLSAEIDKFCRRLGARPEEVRRVKTRLDSIRRKVAEIDRLTYEEGKVSGFENHYYQICCSDMKGDPHAFEREVDDFIRTAGGRDRRKTDLRLGYIGIPPIMAGVYAFVESQGASVVFNELQRQFSMPHMCEDIVDQYLAYTYPYHVRHRLEDIKREIRRRDIHGVIHYVQAFCFRQIEDMIVRKEVGLPVLTLEGNRPGKIDTRSKVRLEAFVDMLRSLGTRR